MSVITETLLLKDIIFEFVNNNIDFYHEDSLNPESFCLSDSAYKSFVNFTCNKKINYQTGSSFQLKELKKTAKKEKYLKENEIIFQNLDSIFKVDIGKDLLKNEEEIKFFLENELISRKHFQRGRMEASLKKDNYVQKALELLNNKEEYNKILGYN